MSLRSIQTMFPVDPYSDSEDHSSVQHFSLEPNANEDDSNKKRSKRHGGSVRPERTIQSQFVQFEKRRRRWLIPAQRFERSENLGFLNRTVR